MPWPRAGEADVLRKVEQQAEVGWSRLQQQGKVQNPEGKSTGRQGACWASWWDRPQEL